MAMPRPHYRTEEEFQKMVNSEKWKNYKKFCLETGAATFGSGL